MLLYLIRHARRSFPADGLTDRGHREARALARRLERYGIDHIFSSPLARARATAAYLAEELELPVGVEPWLEEREEWRLRSNGESLPIWEIDPVLVRGAAPYATGEDWTAVPGLDGPALADLGAELGRASDRFLSQFGYERQGPRYRVRTGARPRVAAVCHAGVGQAWLAHLLALPLPLVWAGFRLPQASLTVVEWVARDGAAVPRCVTLGDASHLEGL